MDKIVVIGKIEESSEKTVDIEYEAGSGTRLVRLPRTLIERLESLGDGRTALLLNIDGSEDGELIGMHMASGPHAPLHVSEEHLRIVEAMEHGEDIMNNDERNDETPQWGSIAGPSITVGDQVVAQVEAGPFDAAFLSGGRKTQEAVNWDFIPVRKPALVIMDDEVKDGMALNSVARVNLSDGEPAAYHIFNPDYKSEKRPAGAYLGTFTKQYYPMPYAEGFRSFLDMAAENGWTCKPLAYKEGKRADLFCDVTSSINWDDVTENSKHGLVKTGDYTVGFVIKNSLDGSSSFKVQAVAMRMLCSNGMVLGSASTLIKLKHTQNTLKGYDFKNLAQKINDVILIAKQEIMEVEGLRGTDITRNTFDKLMTICESKGLITKPSVTRNEQGDVTGLTRGYMWRVLGDGWTKPSNDWVAVEPEATGTLYHVYNILTGAITHKPEWTDGKQVMKGRVLAMDAVAEKLSVVHSMIKDVASGKIDLENVTPFSELIV
mgnify:CR=1 FL=1